MLRGARRTGPLLAALTAFLTVLLVAAPDGWAAAPSPVYAPSGSIADPGVLRDNGGFYVYSTAAKGTVSHGDEAAGPWKNVGAALDLSDPPSWIATGNAIWAPDVWHTSAGYVMYFSAVATDFGGQRCIGVATASTAAGPFKPNKADPPLVCPGGRHGGEDTVPGRPVANAGVIDPSPFQDSEGRKFLLYKTQQTPSSIRMVRLGTKGLHWAGNASGELVRNSGIIENPVMVQKGSQFVLLASRYGYDNCSYATVWMRSTNKWSFSGATEHSLMTSSGTGLCGPGGADVSHALNGTDWRIFLHAWVCGSGTAPCTNTQISNGTAHRRVLYAAVLNWGSDGATPSVGAFL
jgi:hypothetical protein